jgi:heptosyltransferase-2
MLIRYDCRHYNGHIPCAPHKRSGVECGSCGDFRRVSKKVLIIKLGAIGDVIRTTPLLRRIKASDPDAEITWLTYTPEAVPAVVERVLSLDVKAVLYLLTTPFDVVYNLDKDMEACSLANMIDAKEKRGFVSRNGKCFPADESAVHKHLTGLSDELNRLNTKSYPEEIFEMCGYEYRGEEYIVDAPAGDSAWEMGDDRPRIGLNTGCGGRWSTRLWPDKRWTDLAGMLKMRGFEVVLLGGGQEDARNREIAARTGASYFGHFPLKRFVGLVDRCDAVVTSVTMALHIAIGLKKEVVLLNNVFNKREFELYGRGSVIEPALDCLGCFRQSCENACMDLISAEEVFQACMRAFDAPRKMKGDL